MRMVAVTDINEIAEWLEKGMRAFCREPVKVRTEVRESDYIEFVIEVGPTDHDDLFGPSFALRTGLSEWIRGIGGRHGAHFRVTWQRNEQAVSAVQP